MSTVAIDLGGTAVKLGVFDDGLLRASDEFATVDGEIDLDEVAEQVTRLLDGSGPTASASRSPASSTPAARASSRRTASTPGCTTSTSRRGRSMPGSDAPPSSRTTHVRPSSAK